MPIEEFRINLMGFVQRISISFDFEKGCNFIIFFLSSILDLCLDHILFKIWRLKLFDFYLRIVINFGFEGVGAFSISDGYIIMIFAS